MQTARSLFGKWSKTPPRAVPANLATFTFPAPAAEHVATVRDRTRNSGLTSVRFITDDTLVLGDFGNKCCYLARLRDGAVEILDRHDTVLEDGTPVETDLLDYADGRFMVSNFYQGTLSLYAVDGTRIRFLKEVQTGPVPNMHGLRFVPGHPDLAWLTFCNHRQPCHKVLDLKTGAVLHHIATDQQCQDVAFTAGHAVVFARTNHISRGAVTLKRRSKKRIVFATAYVYRLPDDLRRAPPQFVSRWKGKGHIDAVMEAPDGRIFAANQYLDRIDIFRLDAGGTLRLDAIVEGFSLPHGLDIHNGRVAVTNYGDQTLRLFDCPA